MQYDAPQAEWIQGAISVEREGAAVRADFIRKTYIHFLFGLMAFAGIVWWMMNTEAMVSFAARIGFLPSLIGLVVLALSYRWFFGSANMTAHYVGYGLTIAAYAVLCVPLFYYADLRVPGVLTKAFFLTSGGFGALTAYVLISRKDFSFLGGALTMATVLLIVAGILAWSFGGMSMSLVLSVAAIAIFGGWVLYDTSMIQKHLPLNGYVFGATMLFIDFVIILKNVVFLLMATDD